MTCKYQELFSPEDCMAFFGSPHSYIGVDIGTSTSKIVELLDRKRRIELTTYAESNHKNILVNPPAGNQDAIDTTVLALRSMMEQAGTVSDSVVAALPGGVVFSTVLMMPRIPDSEMEQAVRFAARDVVPADIDEMVLGWSSVGSRPHMATDVAQPSAAGQEEQQEKHEGDGPVPVFITAAPKDVVERYIAVFEKMQMTLLALEVETFPLVRSLLTPQAPATMLVDIGSRATTFHIIDHGIPRVSHTIDFGGHDITRNLADSAGLSESEAEQAKIEYGMSGQQDEALRAALVQLVGRQLEKAKDLLEVFERKEKAKVSKVILIGGGGKLKELSSYWAKEFSIPVAVGNPWKGLSYPEKIEGVLEEIGPRFGVAVGLALRGFTQVP